jgi:hypothetical protein
VTPEEAVAALDAITTTDAEYAHGEADEILQSLHPEVSAAYDRVVERADGWWFA